MDRSKQLGEEKVGKLLLKFSIPAIVGMIVNALYNIVDRIFVGQGVGSLAISGIAITFPITTVIMAFGMLVGIGSAALVSIRLGQKRRDEAEEIVGNALVLLIIISSLLMIFGLIFERRILRSFGAGDAVIKYAQDYITIILSGVIFQSVGFGMNNLIRADANPKNAMFTMLIGAVTNTILDPVFIFVFHMGIKGAAIATIISQALSAVWVLSYFFSKRSMLKIHRKNLRLKKNIILSIFSIGMSPFSMQLAASVVTIILNRSLVKYGGDIAVAAMGIINSISMLILMPIFGINQGAQPIIGYNYGAQKYDRVKHTLKLAILAATTICTIGFVAVQLFPVAIISIFNRTDKELIKIGSNGLRIFLSMLPIIGFQIVSSNYFQAVGKPKHSMFLSLSRQVIILIPLLLILPRIFKLKGVWLAGPTADFLSSLLTATFLMFEIRNLKQKHREGV
ncbi:putative efflux protein, MATE family [Caloramator quimbayensis]|uniref:Multidrug export protein MepA n=1 Tax=Caloramator quimbayensis TaxID=1147123 RepID=A0A1T4Y5S7_9CLOT|nr:MATE family efflux transporter [Caloramator quimbayensis]SKA96645.1 putative efflux protein, MATE family [Caloramator quimbayensis]